MDLTIYLFDSLKKLKKPVAQGIVTCIHGERSRTLAVEIPSANEMQAGEFVGLRCIDGRFRMFCVDHADREDASGMVAIQATDAAADELQGTIVKREEAEKITAGDAVRAILAGTGWEIGKDESGEKAEAAKEGLVSAWNALGEIENIYDVWIQAHYAFADGRITGKTVDILAKTPVYRGRFVQRGVDAESIVITSTDRPRPRIYGIGADGLTIADAAWSRANGDPADKPAGQTWIAVPEAETKYPGQGQTYELPDVEDAGELLKKCWEKAQEAAKPTITATATISDMEMIGGQTWKAVRMWDLVRVRPKHGADAQEQIIDIERNYVRPEQTKITLGKEKPSTAKQVKSLMTSSAAANSKLSSYGRSISSNTTELKDTNIRLYELDGYTHEEISKVSIELDAQNAAIDLKASREDVSEIENRLSTAEIRIDGAEAEILLKASQTTVNELGERVTSAEIEIDGINSEITLKADKVYVDAEITEVRNLVADEIDAAIADLNLSISETIVTNYLTVTGRATLDALAIDGQNGSWKETAYVKSVGRTKRYVKSPADVTIEIWEISSISNDTLYYFGY